MQEEDSAVETNARRSRGRGIEPTHGRREPTEPTDRKDLGADACSREAAEA